MSFQDHFADWMKDALGVTPGVVTYNGDFIPSGAVAYDIPARVRGRRRLVRSHDGREVVSSCSAIVLGERGLTVDRHRYTLPERFSPNAMLEAITVEPLTDETGEVIGERLYFP